VVQEALLGQVTVQVAEVVRLLLVEMDLLVDQVMVVQGQQHISQEVQ
tara:strand:- start:260 stop:400 length:141 start_codon:yes stop_codon:yes gene_type:complete